MEVVVPPPTLDFNWEEKPGAPKAKSIDNDQGAQENAGDGFGFEFEFDFSVQLGRASLSAEELFDKGKIRPLKPSPEYSTFQSSSPGSPSSKTMSSKTKEFDPFRAAFEETRRKEEELPITRQDIRGREVVRTSSTLKKGISRSLSPLRVTDIVFDDHQEEENTKTNRYTGSIFSSLSFSSNRYKKWKLKDLLLFRSASEGSGRREGSVGGKYVVLSKKDSGEEVKSSSFRPTKEGSFSRRRTSSAELHYGANREVAEEMRRKTALPYKQGFLGCLGFSYHNPSVHELSCGIGSFACGL